MTKISLILASSSKGRMDLVKQIKFKPDLIISPDIDETQKKQEKPRHLAMRLAKEKAYKVFETLDLERKKNSVILAADTVSFVGTRVVDKSLTDEDIRNAMTILSGKSHRVCSSFCALLINENGEITRVVHDKGEARVKFKSLSAQDIEEMVRTKEGIGKAGGCSVQGIALSFIISMSGVIDCVIGLPLYKVRNTLLSLGVRQCDDLY